MSLMVRIGRRIVRTLQGLEIGDKTPPTVPKAKEKIYNGVKRNLKEKKM